MAAPPDFRLLFSLITKTVDYPIPVIPPILSSFVPIPKADFLISKAHEQFYFSSRVEMGKVSAWLESQEAEILSLILRIQPLEKYITRLPSTISSFLHAMTSFCPDFKVPSSPDKDPDAFRIFRDFVWVTNQIDLKWKHLVQSYIGFRGMFNVYEAKTSKDIKKLLNELHDEMFVACPILTGLRNWAESIIEILFPPSEVQKCVLCNEVLKSVQKPLQLSCGHSYCFRCIVNYFETKSSSCPQCSKMESYNTSKEINFAIFEPWSIFSRTFGIKKIQRFQLKDEPNLSIPTNRKQGPISPPDVSKSGSSVRGLLNSLQSFLQMHTQMSQLSFPPTVSPFPGHYSMDLPVQIVTPLDPPTSTTSTTTTTATTTTTTTTTTTVPSSVPSLQREDSLQSGTPSPTPPKPVKVLIEETDSDDKEETHKFRKSSSETDKGKMNVDGRRILNTSCHQCKSSKDPSKLVFCTRPPSLDKKRRCRKKYCFLCLQRLYGWQKPTKAEQAQWQCPSCLLLCKCAKCRREVEKSGLQPPTEFLKVPIPSTRPTLARFPSDPSGFGGKHNLFIDTLVHEVIDETTPSPDSSATPTTRSGNSRRGSHESKVRRQKSPTQRTSPYSRPERTSSVEDKLSPIVRSSSASPKLRSLDPLQSAHAQESELGTRQRRGTWSFSDYNQYQMLDAIAAITGHLTGGLPPAASSPEFSPVFLQDDLKDPDPGLMMPPPLARPRSAPPGASPGIFLSYEDMEMPFVSAPASPRLERSRTTSNPSIFTSLLPSPKTSSSSTTFQHPTSTSSRIIRPQTTAKLSSLPPSGISSPLGLMDALISPPLTSPSLITTSATSPSIFLTGTTGFTPPLDSLVVPSFSPTGPGPGFSLTPEIGSEGPGFLTQSMGQLSHPMSHPMHPQATDIYTQTKMRSDTLQIFEGLADLHQDIDNYES